MGGCCFVKKWKMFFWTFPQRRVHYVQYQYFFYFTFYLFRGGVVCTQRTPLPTGLWWICRILLPPPAFLHGPIGLHIVQRPAMAVCLSGQMTKIDCFLCVWSARRFRCRRNPL